MFKKIEIWILYLVLILGIPVTIIFGVLVRQELVGSIKLGRVSKTALFLAEIPTNIRKGLDKTIDLQVEDRFPLLEGFNGTPNSRESYLLLSRYDGDLKEGIVELVDLKNFQVLHTWNPEIDKFNELVGEDGDFKFLKRDKNNSRYMLVNPILLKDGGLVFHHRGPLRKIDACSKLIFQNTKDAFHHSIEKDIEGNLWVPSHMFPQSLPTEKVGKDIREEGGYVEDGIVKLSDDGEILFEKSLSQIFIDNGLEYLLFSVGDFDFNKDPIHLNDIQPVLKDSPFFKKGDLFLSLRNLSMIMLYRPSTNKIVRIIEGNFFNQHDIDILDDKRISIYNNNVKTGLNENFINDIVIYNFKTNETHSPFNSSFIKHDIRTSGGGLHEFINDNEVVIEETWEGRLIHINNNGNLLWQFQKWNW